MLVTTKWLSVQSWMLASARRKTGTARALAILSLRPSVVGQDEVANDGVDLVLPSTAAEHAVVADAGLQMMALLGRFDAGAEPVGGHRLADATHVVLLPFDREQGAASDGGRLDRLSAPGEESSSQAIAPG